MNALYDALAVRTAANPQAPLFLEPVGGVYTPLSRVDFLAETDRFTALLRRNGIGDGDCVATWLPNWSSAVAWQFAAAAVGAHVIGINTRYNVAEVAHVFRKARPRLVVMAHDFQRLDLLGKAKAALAEAGLRPAPAVVPQAGPGCGAPANPAAYDVGGGVLRPGPDSYS